ncbi:hypothetical protein G9P44_001403 [Scheffersomyces stipitis]|nr:hypothetical protein G9P44_001403 [Scheffersomyces stipitis]
MNFAIKTPLPFMSSTIQLPDVKIPGIEKNTTLADWIARRNIHFNSRLNIGSSTLGGIGLFFNGKDLEIPEHEEDLEILRIPNGVALDYMNLLGLLHSLKLRDKNYDDIPIKESDLIVNILNGLEPSTETQVLCCYITSLTILRELRKGRKLRYYKTSPLIGYDVYLDILLGTWTLDFPKEPNQDDDEFILSYIKASRNVQFEYDSLIEQLNVLYSDSKIKFDEIFSFETFFKITQAVKSRTLEIPHDADGESRSMRSRNSIVEESDDAATLEELVNNINLDDKTQSNVNGHDFYINVTLVPILDFANHSHDNNSYFDVERKTGDILLRLRKDGVQNVERFEITINYSPIESIQNFIQTYGFIPSLTHCEHVHYQLFELKFSEIDDYIENGTLMCKWLRTLPQIQIVSGSDGEVYLNFFNNNFPFLFIEGLEYNRDWNSEAVENFREFNMVDNSEDIDDDEIVTILEFQQQRYDVINGVQAIGLKYKGKAIKDLSTILEHTGYGDVEDFEKLVHSTIEFVIKYAEDAIKQTPRTESRNNFDDVVNEYNRLKIRYLTLLIEKFKKDPRSLILPGDIADEEWELNYRSVPRELPLE